MNNIKGIAVVTDGANKRIAITFDAIDDTGKVINSNIKVNRIVVDADALAAVKDIEKYAQHIIDAE